MTDTLHPCVLPRRRFVRVVVVLCLLVVLGLFGCSRCFVPEYFAVFMVEAVMLFFAEPHERRHAGAAAGVADALQCGGDSPVLRYGGNGNVFPAVDASHGDETTGADILGGCGTLPLCLGSACALAGAGGSEDAEMTGRGRGFVLEWEHDTFFCLFCRGGYVGAGGLPAGDAPRFSGIQGL